MSFLELPHRILKFAQSLRVLARHVRRHPLSYGSIAALLVGYIVAYVVLVQPARSTVGRFLHAIDDQRFHDAWSTLDPAYQRKYRGGLALFESGYSTTIKHTDIQIESAFLPGRLLRSFSSAEVELTVDFTAIDRLDQDDLVDPIQRFNVLWLRIKHPTRFDMLAAGTLPEDVKALEMLRSFRQVFTVTRKQGEWSIASIKTKATALHQD